MKLSLVALSTLFAAVCASSAASPAVERRLEDAILEDRWYVDNLDLIPDPAVEGQFILEGQTGRNGQYPSAGVRVYLFWTDFDVADPVENVCPFQIGEANAGGLGPWHPNSVESMAAAGMDRVSYSVDGPNHRTELKFKLNENILTSPMFRQIDGENGIVRFCAHFSMMGGNTGATISFRELAVQMSVNLDGSFSVSDILTERFAITADTGESTTFGVTASNCGDDLVYLPGEPIRICVCANNYPATSIVDFVSLNHALISESTIQYTQTTQDITGCVGGGAGPVECCEVHTVLFANQYPSVVGETATKTFIGEVTMAIGSGGARQLVTQSIELPAGRELSDEDETQTFQTEVVLMNLDSAAPTPFGFGWLASIGMAAMMLLLAWA